MRNLKFRAWDALHKKMLTGGETLSQFHPDGSMYAVVYDSEGCSAHIPLMQYTGLKDKNGVEIYEGDIVRIKDCHPRGDGFFDDELVRIYWSEGDLAYFASGAKFSWHNFAAALSDEEITVIGNIYQHPELLEQGE
jgi:uncharacterized phage protein (TIGR01671 family)